MDSADHTVLALILGIVPEHDRSKMLDAFCRIGVSVSFEKAKTALKGVHSLPRQVMNSLEACCVAGPSPLFLECRRSDTDVQAISTRSVPSSR